MHCRKGSTELQKGGENTMERKGIHVVSLDRDELIASLAAIETVLERCGRRLEEAQPENHALLVKSRRKLRNLLFSDQDGLVARV